MGKSSTLLNEQRNKNELYSSALDKQQRHVKMLVELLWSQRLGNSYAFSLSTTKTTVL